MVSSIFISVLLQSPLPAEGNRMNDPVHVSVEYTHEGKYTEVKDSEDRWQQRKVHIYFVCEFCQLVK